VRRLALNVEFDKHVSNAQQNKLHAPVIDASFAGAFFNQGWHFSLSNQRCRLKLRLNPLLKKRYQTSSRMKIKFKGPTFQR
jgi:hypothetical protein